MKNKIFFIFVFLILFFVFLEIDVLGYADTEVPNNFEYFTIPSSNYNTSELPLSNLKDFTPILDKNDKGLLSFYKSISASDYFKSSNYYFLITYNAKGNSICYLFPK